jgi:hypothetical protein
VGGLLVGAAAWCLVRQTPQYSLYKIHQGFAEHSSQALEPFVDFDSFAALPLELAQGEVEHETAALWAPLKALVDAASAVAFGTVKATTSPLTGWYLKSLVDSQRVATVSGAFEPEASWLTATRFARQGDDVTWLTVQGTCLDKNTVPQRKPASVKVVFRKTRGPWFGFPLTWKAVSLEPQSARALIGQCKVW